MAFLGDAAMGAYTLLLYKSQDNHLARVPFTDQFKLESTVSAYALTERMRSNAACHAHEHGRVSVSAPFQRCLCAVDQRAVRDAVQHDSGASRRMDASVPN